MKKHNQNIIRSGDTTEEAAAERAADIETILRLMLKHGWTSLTIYGREFAMTGDGPGSTWAHGTRKEDLG